VDFTVFDRAINGGRLVLDTSRDGYNCELYEVDDEGLIDEVVEKVVDRVYVYRGSSMMYEVEVVMLSTPMHYLKALKLLEPYGYRIYRMHSYYYNWLRRNNYKKFPRLLLIKDYHRLADGRVYFVGFTPRKDVEVSERLMAKLIMTPNRVVLVNP